MKAAPLLLLLSIPSFAAEKTLWLVRPLYPGQEALAGRTEQALDKLTPAILRANHVIGHSELVAALKGKKADDLPCFLGDTRCADPIDPFVATLGFDRVVLIQGGQDESGFKFKVSSYEPASGKTTAASATDTSLDNALIGAVAKVVPVTAALDVTSNPPGATVFVDDRKIGVTPVAAQVLPGERVVRLDLKLHQGLEETVVVPMRGSVKLDRKLEKVAARIIITAQPAGTTISIDGMVLGKDRVDRGVQPGSHTVRLTAENYKAFEQTIQMKPDDQFTLDKSLEPIAGTTPQKEVVIIREAPRPPPQPPPPPPSTTDLYYDRKSYFYVGFEYDMLRGGAFLSHRFGDNGHARTVFINSENRRLIGGSFEFGYFGRYFGIAAIGFTVETNDGPWQMTVGRTVNMITGSAAGCGSGEDDSSGCYQTEISARAMLANIRVIQPAFRVQVWRFMFSLQAGVELRIGQITQSDPVIQYNDGFMILDLGVSGRLAMRFYIVEGFFMYASYKFAAILTSILDNSGALSPSGAVVKPELFNHGFSAGLGYAFWAPFTLLLFAAVAHADALVGLGVGNADTFIAEGTKQYNAKQYAKAIDSFTKATRANPALLPPYLQLARSHLAAKQVMRACYVYRMYLKAASDNADRKKAQAESDQCELRLKTAKGQPPDLGPKYIDTKAAFYAALDKSQILDKDGAFESLKMLVKDGFMGPELGDMAQKLGSAAQASADDVHKRAISYEKLSVEALKSARALYNVARDVGVSVPDAPAASAFCDGLAALQSKDAKKAEALFAEAAKARPENKEYTFYRAVALVQAGDKKGALRVLDLELHDDPRTEVLRTSLALGDSPEAGATELERLLFSRRYPAEK